MVRTPTTTHLHDRDSLIWHHIPLPGKTPRGQRTPGAPEKSERVPWMYVPNYDAHYPIRYSRYCWGPDADRPAMLRPAPRKTTPYRRTPGAPGKSPVDAGTGRPAQVRD
jgi:hypothetical protein